MTAVFHVGDARDVLAEMPDRSVQVCVTSPPYWGLRSYPVDERDLGRAALVDYLRSLTSVFVEIRRVLADDGLLWLNQGDTMSKSGGAGGDYNSGGSKAGLAKWRQGESGLPRLNACMVPARVALALQDDGWILRREIVWDKGRMRRADIRHEKKPLDAHETIYLFSKTPRYRQYMDRLPERGSVWHFPPASGRREHQAPFPPELPRRCILASSEPGDLVLDPFAGRGTTLWVATELGRNAVGIDLDPAGAAVAATRLDDLVVREAS